MVTTMEIEVMITLKTFKNANIKIPLSVKFKDIFRLRKEMIIIEWEGPDFREVKILWGLFSYRSGSRRIFTIQGKPNFCAAVIKELSLSGDIKRKELKA